MSEDIIERPSRLDKLIDTLDLYIDFLKPFKTLLKTAKTQFLVEDFWNNENIIDKELQVDFNNFIDENTSDSIPLNLFQYYQQICDHPNKSNQTKLDKLFLELKRLKQIWNNEILTPAEKFTKPAFTEKFSKNFEKLNVKQRFMKEKKIHEVDIMSKFVAELCEDQGIETVI